MHTADIAISRNSTKNYVRDKINNFHIIREITYSHVKRMRGTYGNSLSLDVDRRLTTNNVCMDMCVNVVIDIRLV